MTRTTQQNLESYHWGGGETVDGGVLITELRMDTNGHENDGIGDRGSRIVDRRNRHFCTLFSAN